jgi:TPR repeat protein
MHFNSRYRLASSLFACIALFCVFVAAVYAQDATSDAGVAEVKQGQKAYDQKDYATAMTWFLKAADKGSAGAMDEIGWMYQHALGMPQNYNEAASWYQKAADKGSLEGMTNLGILYQHGLGLKQFAQMPF